MSRRWTAPLGAIVGLLAGTAVGYCEFMIRYHESGLAPAQMPLLLASRSLLGAAVGGLVGVRDKVPLVWALAGAAVGILVPVEVLNWMLFGKG